MDDSEKASGSGSARGRCRGGKFTKRRPPIHLQTKKPLKDIQIQHHSEIRAIPCNTNSNFEECLMTICCFFGVVDPIRPKNIDLQTVVSKSVLILKRLSTINFEDFEWNIIFDDKDIRRSKISAENNLDERYDNLHFEMCTDDGILNEILVNWFSEEHHEMAVVKYLSEVIGILKSGEMYYAFNPNDRNFKINGESTCVLTECKDIAELANVVHTCLLTNDELSSAVLCEIFGVDVSTPTSNQSARPRRLKADEALEKIQELSRQEQEIDRNNELTRMKENSKKRRLEMSDEEREEERKKDREKTSKKRKDMPDEEREKERKKDRENTSKKRKDMTDEEREEERKKDRENTSKKRKDMTNEERQKEREKNLQSKKDRQLEMTKEERVAENTRMRQNSKRRRIEMTIEEKEAEKLKSKERYKKNQEFYTERNKLNASILKQFKFKAKKEVLIEMLAAVGGGKAEAHIEAEKLINVVLKYRQLVLNGLSSKLVSLVYTLKKCKARSEGKDNISEKFVAMMGSSLHTSNTESYFVDSTYRFMTNIRTYSLNENGKLMDLFDPFTNKAEEKLFSKWQCNEMCNIDEERMHNRFMYIIDETLTSKEGELIELIENIDYCIRRNNLNRITNEFDGSAGVKLSREEGCPCDFCNFTMDSRTIWEKLKYPKEKRIYVDCAGTEGFVEEPCDCDGFMRIGSSWAKLGHPHACYINYSNNYGCTSILTFLRSLAPHFPQIRNIVANIYKIIKGLHKIKALDTAIEGLPDEYFIEHLQAIQDNVKGKAAVNFVSSVEWPYAHEDSITDKYYNAFVAMKKTSLQVAEYVCFSCEKLHFKDNVTEIKDDYRPRNRGAARIWEELLDYHEEQQNNYEYICNYCNDKFKAGTFPPTCILNNLEVKTPPQCITQLNDFEKMFIQRAKAFQVVTRMGSVSGKNRPRREMLQKVKGRTFHLPLPIQKTLEKLPKPEQAIIPHQEMYILVRGIPTKQKQVWQQFVNINRVYEALSWLKENNHLYKDIRLPTNSAENLLGELEDVDVQFQLRENPRNQDNEENLENEQHNENQENAENHDQQENPVIIEKPLVTQKDVSDTFYEHVTIHSITEERPNEEPSTVYQMEKVSAKPIDNREIDLDVKCFPDLFCYGDNGQYAERSQHLSFGEFVKAKIMSVHSQFRLNIQYLFFLLSLINAKQIYSGIYTTLNTTAYVPGMTAKNLRDKLAKKE